MTSGYGSDSVQRVGELIRDYLLAKKEAFGSELYRHTKEHKSQRGSYASFRINYLYKMYKLGLLMKVRRGDAPNPWLDKRQYWQIAPGMEDKHALWRDPQTAYSDLVYKKRGKNK